MNSGCEILRKVTQGCSVVLLTATDTEAAPLRAAMADAAGYTVATKRVYIGDVSAEVTTAGSPGRTGSASIRVALAVSGCDKVNAAMTLASLIQAMSPPPRLVLQVGIAGGLPSWGGGPAARVGDVVLATQEAYSDTGSTSPAGWVSAKDLGLAIAELGGTESGGVFPVDPNLLGWAIETLRDAGGAVPAVLSGACVTSSTVTGTDEEARIIAERWAALAESMEGAAAAHVCALFETPFLEVRGISNVVGERDRASWQVERAVGAAGWAALTLVGALARESRAQYV